MDNKILLAFNAVTDKQRQGLLGECSSWKTVRAIYRALLESGHQIWPINLRNQEQFVKHLNLIPKPDVAFVFAEGFIEAPQTLWDGTGPSSIRNLLAEYGIPSSHSTPEVMNICRRKEITYQRLQAFGLPVPHFQVINPKTFCLDELSSQLSFPLFVKPSGGGNSLGIDDLSIVHNTSELKDRLNWLFTNLGEISAIIESYLPGWEFTVGVIGNSQKYVLPIICFPNQSQVRSFERKKHENQSQWEIIETHETNFSRIQELAIETFEALQTSDVIRIDLKADLAGNFYIIDVNGTPSLSPKASLAYMSLRLGIEHKQLVNTILAQTLIRYELQPNPKLQEIIGDPLLRLVSYGHQVA